MSQQKQVSEGFVQKASRLSSRRESEKNEGQAQQTRETKNNKLKVLKPIINYQGLAKSPVEIVIMKNNLTQSLDDYFFKPVLGTRRLSNKAEPKKKEFNGIGKKEMNISQGKDISQNYLFSNQNHLCVPKGVHSQAQYASQKSSAKKDPELNFLSQNQSKHIDYLRQESYSEKTTPLLNNLHKGGLKKFVDDCDFKDRLSTGRVHLRDSHLQSLDIPDTHFCGPSSKMVAAFESNKQFKNNPLKDISNQVQNSKDQDEQIEKRPLPFEIAPKSTKVNNYFEPANEEAPSVPFSQRGVMTQRIPEFALTMKSKNKLQVPNGTHFEKRRVSDNTAKADEKFRLDAYLYNEAVPHSRVSDKSGKLSQNTSMITQSTSVTPHPQTTTNNNSKRIQLEIAGPALTSKKTLGFKQVLETVQNQHTSQILALLSQQEQHMNDLLNAIKKKRQFSFSLGEVEKQIHELRKQFKMLMNEESLQLVFKKHSRIQYVIYACMQIFDSDIHDSRQAETVQADIVNALSYIQKNFKIFSDIIKKPSKVKKAPKKELNANPFGIGQGSRNAANKENYGTSSNTESKQKSENKLLIKENNKMALGFIVKICRFSKSIPECIQDLRNLLMQIEIGKDLTRIKRQIKRIVAQSKGQEKPKSQRRKREIALLDVDDEPNKPNFEKKRQEQPNFENRRHEQLELRRPEVKQDNLFAIASDKENSPPNLEPSSGRFSLQPQLPRALEAGIQPYTPHIQSPQISILAKRPGIRMQNHDPIIVQNQTKMQYNEDNIQFFEVPAHFNFIQNKSNSLNSRPVLPPEVSRGHEYTLVLDLDETLVHFDPKVRTYRPRPGVISFLCEMSKYFELVVFTAGLKEYADWILNDLDKQGFIAHRLYRDQTRPKNGVYLKDLSKIGRDLKKTIIIDNIEENFQCQPENGIPIKSWYNDPQDRELEKYSQFLKNLVLKRVRDVRPEVYSFKQMLLKESQIKLRQQREAKKNVAVR